MCGASFAEHHVQVDLDRPNHEAFPQFASLPFAECVLEPGQMLYVPPSYGALRRIPKGREGQDAGGSARRLNDRSSGA